MGYRHDQDSSYATYAEPGGKSRDTSWRSGLDDARREAVSLARYLQHGPLPPREGDAHHPPQLLRRDWRVPRGTLSVYAIGQAMVLRGTFNQADLIALRQTFPGQLITLDDEGGPHTMIVWPPTAELATEAEADTGAEAEAS